MKKLLLTLALFLLPSLAMAQCNGVFPNNTVCGNVTGASNTPRATSPSAFLGAAGGTNNQIQYNNSGVLGGITLGLNQVLTGTAATPIALPATTWFDNAFCNTVGFIIARTTGGWVCSQGIPANIGWFGAVASGSASDATANTTAFNNALATGSCVLIPRSALGFNFGTNTLTTAQNGGCITSDGGFAKVQYTGNSAFILYRNLDTGTAANTIPGVVTGLAIDMTGAGSSSTAIRNNISANIIYRQRISHIQVTNFFNAYGDESSASNYVTDVIIDDFRTGSIEKGTPFHSARSRGVFILQNSFFDGSGQATPLATWPSVEFDDFQGIEIRNTHAAQQASFCSNSGLCTPTFSSSAYCFRFQGIVSTSGFIWINTSSCEAGNGTGYLATNTKYLNWYTVRTVSMLGNGVQASSNDFGTWSDIQAVGVVGTPLAAHATAGASGVICDTCTHMNVSNIAGANQLGAGVFVPNSNHNNFTGIMAYGNGTYGLQESGTSDFNIYTALNTSTNTTADYLLVGKNSNAINTVQDSTFAFNQDVGGTPTLTSCGTSPAVNGSSSRGEVTMGTGSPTGCVIAFATPLINTTTKCLVTWKSNLPVMSYDNSQSQLVLNQTGTSSNTIDYWCPGAR